MAFPPARRRRQKRERRQDHQSHGNSPCRPATPMRQASNPSKIIVGIVDPGQRPWTDNGGPVKETAYSTPNSSRAFCRARPFKARSRLSPGAFICRDHGALTPTVHREKFSSVSSMARAISTPLRIHPRTLNPGALTLVSYSRRWTGSGAIGNNSAPTSRARKSFPRATREIRTASNRRSRPLAQAAGFAGMTHVSAEAPTASADRP